MTTPPLPDYYAVLGVAPDAGPAEIKRAFRMLVKRYRPDSSSFSAPVSQEANVMMEVNEAYAVLSDSIRRWRYDQLRLEAVHSAGQLRPLHWEREAAPVLEDDGWQSGLLFCAFPGQHLLALVQQRLSAQTSGEEPKSNRTVSKQMMGALSKAALFPTPFCVATATSAFFWHLGQVTGHPWLASLTAVLAYPLLLIPLLLRLMLPIRYRPLLSLKQKLVGTPLIVFTALLLSWLWVVIVDHNGASTSPFDLYWWCALISVVCICLAYF